MEPPYDGKVPPHGHLGRCAQDVLTEVHHMLIKIREGGLFEPSLVDKVSNMHGCHTAIALWYAASYADMAKETPDDVIVTALEYNAREASPDPR